MSQNFIVTDGRRKYEGIKNWGKIPEGVKFKRLSQLAVSPDGTVYAAQRVAPAILVFGTDGRLKNSWHHPSLTSVHGIYATDEHVYITTFDAHQVLKFTPDGELVLELGQLNNPQWQEPFNHPTGVVVASDGEIYVTDGYANARVHRFTATGELIQSWGECGIGPGEFNVPHALCISSDDRVLVADRDNDRIQIFSRSGELLDIWNGFTHPMDIWAGNDGEFFVADQTPRVVRLSAQGKILGIFRGLALAPHGLSADTAGNLYVADLVPIGITKYQLIEAATV